jgi:hypothetical protein
VSRGIEVFVQCVSRQPFFPGGKSAKERMKEIRRLLFFSHFFQKRLTLLKKTRYSFNDEKAKE